MRRHMRRTGDLQLLDAGAVTLAQSADGDWRTLYALPNLPPTSRRSTRRT